MKSYKFVINTKYFFIYNYFNIYYYHLPYTQDEVEKNRKFDCNNLNRIDL